MLLTTFTVVMFMQKCKREMTVRVQENKSKHQNAFIWTKQNKAHFRHIFEKRQSDVLVTIYTLRCGVTLSNNFIENRTNKQQENGENCPLNVNESLPPSRRSSLPRLSPCFSDNRMSVCLSPCQRQYYRPTMLHTVCLVQIKSVHSLTCCVF